MWILLKTLCSKVLATFADHHGLVRFLIDKRGSNGFISRVVVCSSSDSSYNLTDSSLISVGYQLSFLALLCTRSADLVCTWYYNIVACSQY